MREVAARPTPEAAFGLILVGARGQPGDLGDLAVSPVAEGRRRQGSGYRPGRP